MKRIVLTGGGTAGHVTPHLALLPHLKAQGYEIHYIGTKNGIEHTMIGAIDGITYHSVQSGKLRRYFDWKNFTDPFRVIAGAFQSAYLIGKIKPDVCFSKCGFVSVPVVIGSWLHRVPTLCHESDLTPGLANKICMKFAQRAATTFPECAKALGDKATFTGTPLRPELFQGSREKGLEMAHFTADKPVLLMMGGSLGAVKLNNCLREILSELTKTFDVIHLCGKGNLDAHLREQEGYMQFEYVSDGLNDLFAAADLIVSRAGSNSISEFLALKKPHLLIPLSAKASRGDQILNAASFEKQGFARVLDEDEMTAESMKKEIFELYENRENYVSAMGNAASGDGVEAVMTQIKVFMR